MAAVLPTGPRTISRLGMSREFLGLRQFWALARRDLEGRQPFVRESRDQET